MVRSLLITGASGFLGGHACSLLSRDWQVISAYHTRVPVSSGMQAIALDVTDADTLQRCWDECKPDAVLHTAAISKADQCQQKPTMSHRVNVEGALLLARLCRAAAIPFVFTSTDLVFDGTLPPYKETDQPRPLNVYGHQKATAEVRILAAYPDATVCRLPLLYGAATPTATCFLQSLLATIAASQPLHLFTNEFRTPAEVTDVVHGLNLALQQSITGILHLGGPQRISRYEFGLHMANAFGFSPDLIRPCTQDAVDLVAPRPQDVSLDSQRALARGYSPRPVAVALRVIADATA